MIGVQVIVAGVQADLISDNRKLLEDVQYLSLIHIYGASGAKKFFSITLPLISPTLFLLIVINIIYGLQVFDSVLIMTCLLYTSRGRAAGGGAQGGL